MQTVSSLNSLLPSLSFQRARHVQTCPSHCFHFILTDRRPDNRSYKLTHWRLLFRFLYHPTMTQPCSFYQAGNCRFGDKCRKSHSAHTQANQSPSPSTSVAHPPKSRPSKPLNLPEASSPRPNGVCSFYWTTGKCKREFECIYKHIRCDDGPETTPRRPQFNLAGNDALAPFLTEQGLAKINGIATDGFFKEEISTRLSPTDAHNRFKKFLSDTFRFRNSFDVYAFLVPLSSANCNNSSWVCLSLDSYPICYLFRIRRKKKGR